MAGFQAIPSALPEHRFTFRVRYAETDQMGTFYNARALEWFEVGRTELSRARGLSYTEWEKRGAFLPLVEAHVRYLGRAKYDDLLMMKVAVEQEGRTRLKFYNLIWQQSDETPVAQGYTLHVVVDERGRPHRIPDWVREFVTT